jgi:serine/threonine protein kinase
MDAPTIPYEEGSPRPVPRVFGPGDVLAGRFRIEKLLGKGGMGAVYAATDTTLGNRLVALKTILPELDAGGALLRRFTREVQYAQKVTHTNVCRIFDVGHHDVPVDSGAPRRVTFVTMEHLDGETLSDHLDRVGILSPAQALPMVRQLAAGLDAIHAAGVVHRDFKSPNVTLVAAAGMPRVVITDFGLACLDPSTGEAESRLTATGRFIGSPVYIAPEQIDGSRAITPATDVYALGIVLYEMLTAQRPFTGTSPMNVALKRLTTPPVPPSVHVPDVDRHWETVILRCLARDPAARFPSAAGVLAALENPPETTVMSPADPTVPIDAPPDARRGRLLGAVSIAAIVIAIGAGLTVRWLQRRDPPSVNTMTAIAPGPRPAKTDPLQSLAATLDRPTWPGAFELRTSDGRERYSAGENIQYRVRTDAAGQLHLFVFGRDGAGARIFPNELDPKPTVPAGLTELPRADYSFPVQPPYGEELHVAILSDRPLPLLDETTYSVEDLRKVLDGAAPVRWRAARLSIVAQQETK